MAPSSPLLPLPDPWRSRSERCCFSDPSLEPLHLEAPVPASRSSEPCPFAVAEAFGAGTATRAPYVAGAVGRGTAVVRGIGDPARRAVATGERCSGAATNWSRVIGALLAGCASDEAAAAAPSRTAGVAAAA